MGSDCKMNDPISNFSGQNPKFFKIILQDTIQEQRLAIPKKFVLMYENCLSNRIMLKLPDGNKWEMELSKSENHEAWLQKGWKAFSDHYSLKLACMLVFEYQDESNFNVFIFDATLVEIEYPKKPNFVIPNLDQNPSHLNGLRDAEIEDSDRKCSRINSQSIEASEKFIDRWIKQSLSEYLKMSKTAKDSKVGVTSTIEQSLLEAISAKYGVDKSNRDAEIEHTNEEHQDACNKGNGTATATVDCGINALKIDEKRKRVKVCAGRGKRYRRSAEEDEDFVCDSNEEEDVDDDYTLKSYSVNWKRNVGEIKEESIDEVVRKGKEKIAVKEGVERKVKEVVSRTVKTKNRFPVDEFGGGKVELGKKEKYKDVGRKCKEGVKERVLSQRIRPKMFMENVIQGMPESHKAAIRNIGFGGFLYLDLDAHNSSFARELVMSFDVDRCSLVLHKDQEIDVLKEDVHLVYGLPLGGEEIQEVHETVNEEFVSFFSKWRALFEIERGSPTNAVVIKEIERLKKEPLCEAFLLHFVLCAVNCCIRSTNNSTLRFKFLYSCRDVTKISTLDWCGFVYKHLKESVIEWQEGSSFFTGPLPFLQICYFDRLQRAREEKPRKFPLISVWNKEMIKQRIVVETNNGFGKGLVLERIEYEDVVQNEAQTRRM